MAVHHVAPGDSATARVRRHPPEQRSREPAAVNVAVSAPAPSAYWQRPPCWARPVYQTLLVPHCARLTSLRRPRRPRLGRAPPFRPGRVPRSMLEKHRSRDRSPPMLGRCRHATRTSPRPVSARSMRAWRRRAAASTRETWRLRRLSPKCGPDRGELFEQIAHINIVQFEVVALGRVTVVLHFSEDVHVVESRVGAAQRCGRARIS